MNKDKKIKELSVSAIKEGTVIDHIPARHTFKVADILKLQDLENSVVIATNLKSTKLGMKGIIKTSGLFLDKKLLQKISLIAPKATVSKIKNYKAIEKTKLERPKLLNNIIKCVNPNCITNNEPMDTKFVVEKEKPLLVRCRYCERSSNELELL